LLRCGEPFGLEHLSEPEQVPNEYAESQTQTDHHKPGIRPEPAIQRPADDPTDGDGENGLACAGHRAAAPTGEASVGPVVSTVLAMLAELILLHDLYLPPENWPSRPR